MLEVQEQEADEEAAFEKEIQKRFEDYETGKITPITMAEFESGIKSFTQRRKQSAK